MKKNVGGGAGGGGGGASVTVPDSGVEPLGLRRTGRPR